MNLLDFFILIPILFFAIRGIKNGLIGEVLGVVGLIIAVFLTFQYMDEVADIIRPLFNSDANYIVFIAATLIFVLTLIVVQIVDYLAASFLRVIRLHTINRVLGFFFGFLKGAIIVSAVLLLLAGFQYPSEQSREDSVTYSYVVYIAPWAYNLVADENFTNTVEETFEDVIENFPIVIE